MATSWHLEIRKGEVSCDISPTIMVIYPSVTSTAPPSRCSFCKCSDCLGSSFGFMTCRITCRITWSLALSSQSDFVSTALMLGMCGSLPNWGCLVLTCIDPYAHLDFRRVKVPDISRSRIFMKVLGVKGFPGGIKGFQARYFPRLC